MLLPSRSANFLENRKLFIANSKLNFLDIFLDVFGVLSFFTTFFHHLPKCCITCLTNYLSIHHPQHTHAHTHTHCWNIHQSIFFGIFFASASSWKRLDIENVGYFTSSCLIASQEYAFLVKRKM